MLILLVDDEPDFRSGLAENLRDDGHHVLDFADPSDVPPRLDGVDVLLTDYLMKGEDGLRFANRFHDAHPAVPVVMLTAFSTVHVENAIADSGYVSLVHKPVDYDTLSCLIENLTENGSP